MGAVTSRSPVERRNTVLRRSQRKSIHGVKGKTDKLIKDIKKFKGTEENAAYVDLKARIEVLERDLKHTGKTLQPQIQHIFNETLKKTEDCHRLLANKLAENVQKKQQEEAKEKKDEVEKKEEVDEDFFVEETNEEHEETNEEHEESEKRAVELKLIQVEPIEASPQLNKRMSLLKVGVPVMPGAIMEDMHRRTQDLGVSAEGKVAEIRKIIEAIEMEISQFVGKKNGHYYNKIKEQLTGYEGELKTVPVIDEAIGEQVKLCSNYINSCLSFLDEKAVDEEDSDSDVPEGALNGTGIAYHPPPETYPADSLSRTMKTTYI